MGCVHGFVQVHGGIRSILHCDVFSLVPADGFLSMAMSFSQCCNHSLVSEVAVLRDVQGRWSSSHA